MQMAISIQSCTCT